MTIDTSVSGMKLITRGSKVRGRAVKQQQSVGINETDVKVSLIFITINEEI
jgi:hypothetical protein